MSFNIDKKIPAPVLDARNNPPLNTMPPTKFAMLSGVAETMRVVSDTSIVVTSMVPQGNVEFHDAKMSWGVVSNQYVGDRTGALEVVRSAARRTVRQYGEALERLAD